MARHYYLAIHFACFQGSNPPSPEGSQSEKCVNMGAILRPETFAEPPPRPSPTLPWKPGAGGGCRYQTHPSVPSIHCCGLAKALRFALPRKYAQASPTSHKEMLCLCQGPCIPNKPVRIQVFLGLFRVPLLSKMTSQQNIALSPPTQAHPHGIFVLLVSPTKIMALVLDIIFLGIL